MPKRKGSRSRIKTAEEALRQLEEIQRAQEAFRKAGRPEKIQNIRKSKDRFRNANRNLRKVEDFFDDYL